MAQVWDTVSSQPSCRRSQPKCPKGKAGEGRTFFLPHGHLILQPWIRGTREAAGLPGRARTGQTGLAFPLPMVPAGHLHKHYVHLQHFGCRRHNTPDHCFTRAVSVCVWPRGRQVPGCKPPQLGLVPVTSAKPRLSCCHSPIVTQRLKANAHTSHSLPCLITQHLALSSLLLLSQADLFLANPDCSGLKTS